jgi:hypothetical protein
MIKRVQSFLNTGEHTFAHVEIEHSDEWRALRVEENRDGCDEVMLWLGELLEYL